MSNPTFEMRSVVRLPERDNKATVALTRYRSIANLLSQRAEELVFPTQQHEVACAIDHRTNEFRMHQFDVTESD